MTTLEKVSQWLTELGIKNTNLGKTLLVNRDDVVNIIGNNDESECYREMTGTIRDTFSNRIFVTGKDDENLSLEMF